MRVSFPLRRGHLHRRHMDHAQDQAVSAGDVHLPILIDPELAGVLGEKGANALCGCGASSPGDGLIQSPACMRCDGMRI